MNNFGSENMGVLLHKLTKYQTLLSNCGTPSKSAVYNQKIDYYSNKLNGAGISQNNIRNMRNLIGGVDEGEARQNVTDLQALLDAPPSPPVAYVDPNNEIIEQISTNFNEVLRIHEQNKQLLATLQEEKRVLTTQNSELTTQIATKLEDIKLKTEEIKKLTSEKEGARQELQQKSDELTAKVTELELLNTAKTVLEEQIIELQKTIDSQNAVITKCINRLRAPKATGTEVRPNPTALALLQRLERERAEMALTNT
jgi:DNA repair exonuclease SbcCD ATPase subunit